MFAFYKKHNNNLYIKLVNLSRNIFFYKDLQLKDTFETRIILIFIHFSLLLQIYKKRNKKSFPQDIFDNIFQNIEYHLRELGHGDVSCNKKMKTLSKVFYNILLKINDINNDKLELNTNLIKEELFANKNDNEEKLIKINEYFTAFYNFCFVLNDNNMIEGNINFKF
ncbi:MAG: ubiquinol-cytochrome C chaperone family protein [Pelagibacteraceae bacterium]